MAKFQFRKRKKLAPGLYLNISKRGFGVSAGPKGAKISRSATGRVTGSVGIPGSGISYRKRLNQREAEKNNSNLGADSNIRQSIEDKAAYIKVHGNVLTKSEIRKALIYLACLMICSITIPFAILNGENSSTILALWLIFAILYMRESGKNKRKWIERSELHLQSCEHSENQPE